MFSVHGKIAWDGPKWGQEGLFPANPDLADILGRTDLDFDNFNFVHYVDSQSLDFQVPRFPKSGLGRAWALDKVGPWVGRAGLISRKKTFLAPFGAIKGIFSMDRKQN